MASFYCRGLKFSVFGESHGDLVGVVVDNFPAGVKIDFERIQAFVNRRCPSGSKLGSSLRVEADEVKIMSGIVNGKTTGSPICAMIFNSNSDSRLYEKFKDFLRPGHADFTANARYFGFNDFRGSGHLSGRLTAPLVVVGALCEQLLLKNRVFSFAHIASIGQVADCSFLDRNFSFDDLNEIKHMEIPVLDKKVAERMKSQIEICKKEGDSIGAVVECALFGVEPGIGSPMFDKISNYLADLVFAIPGVRAIEFGAGFEAAKIKGSQNNDEFVVENGRIKTRTNNHGGVLGGISSGMPIVFRVAIKPTPTIFRQQTTVNTKTMEQVKVCFEGNHDVCIALRAVCVVEAVANIAIVSQFLNQGRFKVGGVYERN